VALSGGRQPADALDEHAQVRVDVLAHDPIDGHVSSDGGHELTRDGAKGVVAKDLNGAVLFAQQRPPLVGTF
jgi:hypothetical protein